MKRLFLLMIAVFFAGWVSAQTKTEVKPTDLPKPITEYLAKSVPGFDIDKAFKVVNNGIQTYDVLVKKDKLKHTLSFDNKGTFVKMLDKEGKDNTQKAQDQLKPSVPSSKIPTTAPTQLKKK